MKKSLLFIGALAAGFCASAISVDVMPDFYCLHMSPNGRYIVSDAYGEVKVLDNETGEAVELYDEGFSVGNGNCISNTGWLVGNINYDDAAVLIDGEWVALKVPYGTTYAYPSCITPDNKFIFGTVSGAGDPMEGQQIAAVPIAWELLEDGTYGEGYLLSYPAVDPLTNMVPQYVQPVTVSDDGKHVFGQITHNLGFMLLPIMWEYTADNEWHYSYPGLDLFNPNHLELPEYCGDFEEMAPEPADFMSPENREAYEAALQYVYESGDWEAWPNEEDYMTADDIAAYFAAYDVYQEHYAEWEEKYYAFYEPMWEIIDASPSLEMNQVYCSPDGNTVVYNASEGGGGWWSVTTGNPMQVDVKTGKATLWNSGKGLYCSQVYNDGTVFGHTPIGMRATEPCEGYIKLAGEEDFTSLFDYFSAMDEYFNDWAMKNWVHEYIDWVYDEETDDYYEDFVYKIATGFPLGNPDLSVINTTVLADWADAESYFYTYHFTGLTSGVKNVSADSSLVVKSLGKGNLGVSEPAQIDVYTLSGACVYSAPVAAGTVATGVETGVYVVKATDAKGNTTISKFAF